MGASSARGSSVSAEADEPRTGPSTMATASTANRITAARAERFSMALSPGLEVRARKGSCGEHPARYRHAVATAYRIAGPRAAPCGSNMARDQTDEGGATRCSRGHSAGAAEGASPCDTARKAMTGIGLRPPAEGHENEEREIEQA